MGLLLKLENEGTKFYDLKYGDNSKAPYIRTPLPDYYGKTTSTQVAQDPTNIDEYVISKNKTFSQKYLEKTQNFPNLDGFIRGGVLAPLRAGQDVVRLTRWFSNLKNGQGLLFASKQNILSAINVRTESVNVLSAAYAAGTLNGGIYTPLNNIAQAGVGFLGIHLNEKGLDPFGVTPLLNIIPYQKRAFKLNKSKKNKERIKNNRLKRLAKKETKFNKKIKKRTDKIGELTNGGLIPYDDLSKRKKRKIKRANNQVDRFNNSLTEYRGDLGNFKNRLLKLYNKKIFEASNSGKILQYYGGPDAPYGVGITKIKFATGPDGKTPVRTGKNRIVPKSEFYEDPLFPTKKEEFARFGKSSLAVPNYRKNGSGLAIPYSHKFYPSLLSKTGANPWIVKHSGDAAQGPSSPYGGNKEIKVQFYKNKGKKTGYVKTKNSLVKSYRGVNPLTPLTSLSGKRLYDEYGNSTQARAKGKLTDFIEFSIKIRGGKTADNYHYYTFPAFIDGISNSYKSSYKGINYMGRGEKFYKYSGFDEGITFNFTVVAQSQVEIEDMYLKLNEFATSVMPSYTDYGYMSGNVASLKVGDLFDWRPGLIEGFTFSIPEEATWDIGIKLEEQLDKKNNVVSRYWDGGAHQYPMMIKVTGFKFQPIYHKIPQYLSSDLEGMKDLDDSLTVLGRRGDGDTIKFTPPGSTPTKPKNKGGTPGLAPVPDPTVYKTRTIKGMSVPEDNRSMGDLLEERMQNRMDKENSKPFSRSNFVGNFNYNN